MIGMQWLYNHSHHSSNHDGAADQSRAWNGSNGVDPPNENTPNYNFGEVYIHPKARSLPGKTAGNFDRQFAVHDYHDRALDAATGHLHEYGKLGAPFPIKLHHVLNDVQLGGLDHVISWASHGRCLLIHMPKVFVEQVMPKYFRQSKLASFQRQLYLYGFKRLTCGQDAGGYYHECFLRGKPALALEMKRVVVKGTRIKAASNPQQEPNFYQLPPVDQSMSSGNLSNVNIDTCLESSVAIVTSSQPAANGAVVTSVTQQHQAPPVQLPTSAAQQEAGCLGWFRHMVPFGDAIFDNMFDDGTDSESVDVAMILDFCSDWAPVK